MRKTGGTHRWLGRLFWLGAAAAVVYGWYGMDRLIPDRVSITADKEEEFFFDLPMKATISSESREVVLGNESNIPKNELVIGRNEPFSMYASNKGSYQVDLKLLGILKFKDIQVDVVDTRYAVPCGSAIGIYLKSDGVMVIGTGRIAGEDGVETEPAFGKLKSGDYIEAVNGSPMETKEELAAAVGRSGGQTASLQVRRQGQRVDVQVQPVKGQDGQYRLGAWVRDDTQGIGTITYVDSNGRFGALGHGISDSDTGELVEAGEGALYATQIMGIQKGTIGKPGLLSGVIYYGPGSHLGEITANTNEGIFGTVNSQLRKQLPDAAVEVASPQEARPGPAVIRSAVDGSLRDYEIEIQKVDYHASRKNKSMVIKVTDPALLELTGGIVQGMSGSPILQNGKLAGAVTHVFVQDSARGYGIFAEDMM